MIRERVIMRDRIVRLPAEQPRKGIYDRLTNIDGATVWGPELGVAVAFLLIVLTFWELG